MNDTRTSKTLLALIAAMTIGSGAALAQDAGGGAGADGSAGANAGVSDGANANSNGDADANSGKSQPLNEETDQTMKGMEGEYGSALDRPDTGSGQINENGPAYQDTHEDRENPSGPVTEPVE